MIFAEYAHYLGVLIMALNIQLSSNDVNIFVIYGYGANSLLNCVSLRVIESFRFTLCLDFKVLRTDYTRYMYIYI